MWLGSSEERKSLKSLIYHNTEIVIITTGTFTSDYHIFSTETLNANSVSVCLWAASFLLRLVVR